LWTFLSSTFLFIEKKVSGSPSSKHFIDLHSKTDFITVAILVFLKLIYTVPDKLSRLIRYLLSVSIENTELIYLFFSRDSPKKDIAKSYRKLAGKWHPDMFRYIYLLQGLSHEMDLSFGDMHDQF
jgi:hypothetical protein